MKNGFEGKNKLCEEWNTYNLCEIFGCTPSELDEQDDVVVEKMIAIHNIVVKHPPKK